MFRLLMNKKYWIKGCIIINVALLLYAAVHLTNNNGQTIEWVPIPVEGADRAVSSIQEPKARYEYIVDPYTNNSYNSTKQDILTEESATSKRTTTNMNKTTVSSTISVAEIEKKILENMPSSENPVSEPNFNQTDQNILSDATLSRLKLLLACNERDFLPMTKQRGEHWSLVNYVKADHGNLHCYETVTYTTHAGFEFLDNVLPLVERWMAPISLAIFAPGADMTPTANSIRFLRDCTGSDLIRSFVTFHIFFPQKHIPSKIPDPEEFLGIPYNCSLEAPYNVAPNTTYMKQKNLLYPINVARNIAREAALSHFILPSDIELYPSPNLVPQFLNMIARNKPPLSVSKHPRVFPISIFEVNQTAKVPSTKTELQDMLAKKTAIPFHQFLCPQCHTIPQRKEWIKTPETAAMEVFHVGKRKGKFSHWEPIFIGTQMDPLYDERLSWEGKQDKMTQGYILCVNDYDFMILTNAFLIHKPGIKHYKHDKRRDAITARQNKFIKQFVLPELKRLYKNMGGCLI